MDYGAYLRIFRIIYYGRPKKTPSCASLKCRKLSLMWTHVDLPIWPKLTNLSLSILSRIWWMTEIARSKQIIA